MTNRLRTCLTGIAVAFGLAGCASLDIPSTGMRNAVDTTMGTYQDESAERYILVTMTDHAHGKLIKGESVSSEGRLPPLYANFLSHLSKAYGITRVADWPLGTLDIRCLVFTVEDASQRKAVLSALQTERFVESAQPMNDFLVMGSAGSTYNDPYLNLQHGLASMQVPQAHRFATGMGVRIAVVDTGIDTQHVDLRKRVTGTRNFVDRNARQFKSDVHGTAVASVIAASSNNAQGMVGVAPDASIVGLKACWQTGAVGGKASCNSFTLAKAINFAIAQRVDVINLSLAGPYDPLLERLVKRAVQENILVIGAVSDRWADGFPSSVEGVIAAADDPMYRAADARRIVAPGNNILSAAPNDNYDFQDGSSFSAAHLSGIAALIRQRKPHLPTDVVRELLSRSGPQDGAGTNACKALSRLVATSDACIAGAGVD